MDPGYFDTERTQNPKEKANVFSKVCFWYTRPIFAKGRKGQLHISDVYRCSPGHRAAPRGDVLKEKWKQELDRKENGKNPSLLRAILRIYGLKFIIGNIIFGIVDAAFRLSIPMCLEGLIMYFSSSKSGISTQAAYLYALGVVGLMAINAAMIHPMLLWLLNMSMKIRVACCSLIYRKLLRLDLTAGGKASEGLAGHVINLLTTDAQRFDMASLFLVDLVRTPIESILIVYLMYRQIGVATLIGVAFLLSFIPLQAYLSKISSKLRHKTAVRTDHRIRLMNEVIQSIEAIKMNAWEQSFAKIIGNARRKEMNVIKKMSWLRAVMISCVKLNTKVAIFLSIISFLSFDNELTAAKVFVIFSYYEILKYTLVEFLPLAITFTLEAYVSVKRMQEFLVLPEVDNQDGVDLMVIEEPKVVPVFEKIGNGQQAYIKSDMNLQHEKPSVLISMRDYTADWKSTDADNPQPTPALVGINLDIKPETLTTIVGMVGSGKSTLLQAILRELSPSSGTLEIKGVVAYAAQDPWLFEASVRQNILFGQDMDLRRYKQVIRCCQLRTDLDILPNGDKTVVGERGASLSGGQRARIALARCVYRHASVYLLDDPLAAVDAKSLNDDLIIVTATTCDIVVATDSKRDSSESEINGKQCCQLQKHAFYLDFIDSSLTINPDKVKKHNGGFIGKVAQAIYDDCIRGFLRDKAVVLVTHHVQYARHADTVCVMRNGAIVAQGTYLSLKNSVAEFETLIELGEKTAEEQQKLKGVFDTQENVVIYNAIVKSDPPARADSRKSELNHMKLRSQRSMSEASQLSFNLDLDNQLNPVYEGEAQAKGKVSSSVYLSYIKSGGTKLSMAVMCVLFLLAQIFYSSTDVWLKEWVNIEEANSAAGKAASTDPTAPPAPDFQSLPINRLGLTRNQCVYIYGALIGVCVVLTWNKLVLFYNTCIRASVALHDNMFRGVTNAPMWFFHHNPSGRILNRFSKDLGQIDTLLPVALVDCLGFFLEVMSILVVVCLVNWWLLLPTCVVAASLFWLRALFLSTSRELKRIEAIARSQSLNHCAATVNGLTTIRSAREQQRTLAREFDKLQDLHSSSWALVLVTNRAFGFWMDMLCCIYLFLVTFSFFFFTYDSMGGTVGLAITQVIGLVGMCQYGMKQTAEVENQMTSVERILEYTSLPAESPVEPDLPAWHANHPELDFDKWPVRGEIVFEDVSLEYEKPPKKDAPIPPLLTDAAKMEDRHYAIRDVSFTVRPAEKVAVVGRTGAGKSSLLAALFRLSKTTGKVSVDGVTPEEAGLKTWRSRLCALPQRPALFAATLRENLDPEEKYTDDMIYCALEQVELREMVANLPAGLSTKVGDGGGTLSLGQRQLVCLARAAMAGCGVLVLDEATANVDTETDKHIQHTIRTTFANSTVLTIAHRLNTVMDYDRVIVMDKGRVVEYGHPFELLTSAKSDQHRRPSLLAKTQAPLAIPENFPFESSSHAADQNETLVLSKDRIRTYSNRSEQSDSEGGIFKSLVEQTGPDTARMLYDMAEQSYYRMYESKKTT